MAEKRDARYSLRAPKITFLWHPGTKDIFSGYGLVLGPGHLVGLVMVDRPKPLDPAWLAVIEQTFGSYQLVAMTQSGERGIVCQMHIAKASTRYLRVLPHPRTEELRDVLVPLLADLPAVTLALAWSPKTRYWVSQIVDRRVPLFPLGRVVATAGALQALENAGQEPEEFLNRHDRGDWGDISVYEKQENDHGLAEGSRVVFLSAYALKTGQTIWVRTNLQRGETAVMLSHERVR